MDAFQEMIQARDTVTGTVPAVCFGSCNNAYLEAQAVGTIPDLCLANSAFNRYYNECNSCVDENRDQLHDTTRQYLDSTFSQYVSYCKTGQTSTSTQVVTRTIMNDPVPTSWLTWYETFEPTTMFELLSLGVSTSQTTVLYKNVNITSTLPAYFLHISAQSLISTYIPPAVFSELAASAASAASVASITGDATSLVYAALEDTSRPPWFSSAVPSTYAAQMSTLEASLDELRTTAVSIVDSTQDSVSTGSSSKALIVGAVVGSVAGVALILLGIFLFLRRRKRVTHADKWPDIQGGDSMYMTGGKPELHSDSVPPPPRIYEMSASQSLSEMAVHEKPQELNAEQVSKKTIRPAWAAASAT